METGLQIITNRSLIKLTKGQHGLFCLITDSVKNNKPIVMDDIVCCYVQNIRKIYYNSDDCRYNRSVIREYYVYEEFKNQSYMWTYRIRAVIKTWFIQTIGTLILKGKLIALPIIEIEE